MTKTTRQRIIVVYNPRSSQAKKVQQEVLAVGRKLRGITLGRYEVRPTNVEDNARRLAKLLTPNDIVVSAGGDGTAAISVNACMLSGKDVSLGVLPYGNFNDTARTFRLKKITDVLNGEAVNAYPLDVVVDDRHWRYAMSYLTIGLFAESTRVFDEKKTRRQLRKGRSGLMFSILTLAKWYFGHRHKEFLPEFKLNNQVIPPKTSDYLAVNSRTVAKIMRSKDYYSSKQEFWSSSARLKSLPRLLGFMLRSMVWHIPGGKSNGDTLKFTTPTTVEAQVEGEYATLSNVSEITIRKSARPLKMII